MTTGKTFVTGDDPYLVGCVTEKLFPQLTLEHSGSAKVIASGAVSSLSAVTNTPTLHVVTLREGDRSVTLPSLSIEQNYSQMLSELVMHI